jgi:hypothetical protein
MSVPALIMKFRPEVSPRVAWMSIFMAMLCTLWNFSIECGPAFLSSARGNAESPAGSATGEVRRDAGTYSAAMEGP